MHGRWFGTYALRSLLNAGDQGVGEGALFVALIEGANNDRLHTSVTTGGQDDHLTGFQELNHWRSASLQYTERSNQASEVTKANKARRW
jgi:hypothetical protein